MIIHFDYMFPCYETDMEAAFNVRCRKDSEDWDHCLSTKRKEAIKDNFPILKKYSRLNYGNYKIFKLQNWLIFPPRKIDD